jgi:NADH-quinone oxidoreductase subunit K
MTIPIEHYLILGATLFTLGMVGFLTRRSMILMFLSLEMMLAGASVNLIAFSRHHQNYQGQVFAVLVLTVAACEAALALAIVVALFRRKPTLDIRQWTSLGEVPASVRDAIERPEPPEEGVQYPRLAKAGPTPKEQRAMNEEASRG